ncbi:hypothetical protein MalM25_06280 [Planctomycetes bacterium MalM25]|nr:hypothetical protein MalM25_06280 [Planctomycetes bacterium MalM25]
MSETDPNNDLIARYRAAFDPPPPTLDERTLWYEAGRAAAAPQPGGWLLPAYSGAVTVLAASLAWALVRPPVAEPPAAAPPMLVATPAPTEPASEEPIEGDEPALTPWAKLFPASLPARNAYAERQQRMLRDDFIRDNEIATTVPFEYEPAPPATRERLLEEYLPNRDLPVPPKPSEGRQNTQQTRRGAKELA